MILLKPKYEIESISNDALDLINFAGRLCYRVPAPNDKEAYKKYVRKIIKAGHESVIEHSFLSVLFLCDRGISHQLVRHRLASFTQESSIRSRQLNDELEFIVPFWLKGIYDNVEEINKAFKKGWNTTEITIVFNLNTFEEAFLNHLQKFESTYKIFKEQYGREMARDLLPTCLATRVLVSANFREWRHILKLRTSKHAHPQIKELMLPLLEELKMTIPVIFDDIEPYKELKMTTPVKFDDIKPYKG